MKFKYVQENNDENQNIITQGQSLPTWYYKSHDPNN